MELQSNDGAGAVLPLTGGGGGGGGAGCSPSPAGCDTHVLSLLLVIVASLAWSFYVAFFLPLDFISRDENSKAVFISAMPPPRLRRRHGRHSAIALALLAEQQARARGAVREGVHRRAKVQSQLVAEGAGPSSGEEPPRVSPRRRASDWAAAHDPNWLAGDDRRGSPPLELATTTAPPTSAFGGLGGSEGGGGSSGGGRGSFGGERSGSPHAQWEASVILTLGQQSGPIFAPAVCDTRGFARRLAAVRGKRRA